MKKKPNGYWTYERCKDAAFKCSNKGEFQKRYSTAYATVLKNKWIDLTQHMEIIGNKVNDPQCLCFITDPKFIQIFLKEN